MVCFLSVNNSFPSWLAIRTSNFLFFSSHSFVSQNLQLSFAFQYSQWNKDTVPQPTMRIRTASTTCTSRKFWIQAPLLSTCFRQQSVRAAFVRKVFTLVTVMVSPTFPSLFSSISFPVRYNRRFLHHPNGIGTLSRLGLQQFLGLSHCYVSLRTQQNYVIVPLFQHSLPRRFHCFDVLRKSEKTVPDQHNSPHYFRKFFFPKRLKGQMWKTL